MSESVKAGGAVAPERELSNEGRARVERVMGIACDLTVSDEVAADNLERELAALVRELEEARARYTTLSAESDAEHIRLTHRALAAEAALARLRTLTERAAELVADEWTGTDDESTGNVWLRDAARALAEAGEGAP